MVNLVCAVATGLVGVCCSTVIRIFACSSAVFSVSVTPVARSCLLTSFDRPIKNWCNHNYSVVWAEISLASLDSTVVSAREHTGTMVLPDAILK